MAPWMIVAIVLAGLCACASTYALVRRLQVHHPEIWESTGRPSPLGAAFGFGAFGLQRFILSPEFSALGDSRLIAIRRMLLATFAFILLSVVFASRFR